MRKPNSWRTNVQNRLKDLFGFEADYMDIKPFMELWEPHDDIVTETNLNNCNNVRSAWEHV